MNANMVCNNTVLNQMRNVAVILNAQACDQVRPMFDNTEHAQKNIQNSRAGPVGEGGYSMLENRRKKTQVHKRWDICSRLETVTFHPAI